MYRPINDCIGRLMTLSADNPIGTDIPIFRKFDRYRIGRLSADYRLPISDRYGICAYTSTSNYWIYISATLHSLQFWLDLGRGCHWASEPGLRSRLPPSMFRHSQFCAESVTSWGLCRLWGFQVRNKQWMRKCEKVGESTLGGKWIT